MDAVPAGAGAPQAHAEADAGLSGFAAYRGAAGAGGGRGHHAGVRPQSHRGLWRADRRGAGQAPRHWKHPGQDRDPVSDGFGHESGGQGGRVQCRRRGAALPWGHGGGRGGRAVRRARMAGHAAGAAGGHGGGRTVRPAARRAEGQVEGGRGHHHHHAQFRGHLLLQLPGQRSAKDRRARHRHRHGQHHGGGGLHAAHQAEQPDHRRVLCRSGGTDRMVCDEPVIRGI